MRAGGKRAIAPFQDRRDRGLGRRPRPGLAFGLSSRTARGSAAPETTDVKASKTSSSARRVAACGLFAACAACGAPEAQDEYVIGALLPFTGIDNSGAYNLERALLMVLDQANAAGGVGGKRLRLVTKDTRSRLDQTQDALGDVLASKPVALIGVESVEGGEAVLPTAASRRIPFVSPLIASDGAVEAQFPWWRFGPSAATLGDATAKRLRAEGVGSISVVYGAGEYHGAFARALSERFVSLGGTIVASLRLAAGDRTQASELPIGPDQVVVLAEYPALAARFVNDLDATLGGRRVQWWLSPPLQTRQFVQNTLPRAIEGARGLAAGVFPGEKAFVSAFQERWLGDSPLPGAFYCYDAAAYVVLSLQSMLTRGEAPSGDGAADGALPPLPLFNEAFSQLGRPTGEQVGWDDIGPALGKIEAGQRIFYQGLTGPISWNGAGERQAFLFTYWAIRGGDIVVAEE